MKHVRIYIFLYFTASWLLDVVYRCLDSLTRNQPPHWAERTLEQATGYYLAMVLLPWIFFVTRRFPVGVSWRPAAAHPGGVISYALAHTSLMWGSRLILFPLFGLGRYDYGAMPTRYFMELPSQFIHYAEWVAAYTVYHNWLRTKDLEKQLVAARLSALTHRLQPHFLFNALNAVSTAIYEDPQRADKMLERLSDFLRATLKVPDAPMVPLSSEFRLARQYLEVMKARLEDRLQFEIECDADSGTAEVPALLLQPLVENAIEHGQDPLSGRIEIHLKAIRENGFVSISICDRGRGFISRAPSPDGHGLSNVRQRLKTVYRDHASLDLDGDAGNASVVVRIPV
jgi:two-component system, LytTR family, sensor kinase